MTRIARVVIPGVPYHLTHRGLNGQQAFLLDDDFSDYLSLLKHFTAIYDLGVLAYCLMPTHIHLAGIPKTSDALAQSMRYTQGGYARKYNNRHHRHGYLWDGRYFSCSLEEIHLINALRYIERNPVRRGLVNHAWEYPWSSAVAHITGHDATGLLDMDWWHRHFESTDWLSMLHQPEDETWLEQIRRHTQSGYPLGSDTFLTQLEQRTGQTLHAKPRGRPKKQR